MNSRVETTVALAVLMALVACEPALTSPGDEGPFGRTSNPTTSFYGGSLGFNTCERFGQAQSQLECQRLRQLDHEMRIAILDQATRLQNYYPTHDVCHSLATLMMGGVDRTYLAPYMFRDPIGRRVAGDIHMNDPSMPDEVHVADSIDYLNGRDLRDKLSTVRHEWAHRLGYHHNSTRTTDQVANDCNPDRSLDPGDPFGEQPYVVPGAAW